MWAKIQHEKGWKRKSAISVHVAEIAGSILSSSDPAVRNLAVDETPLVINDTQPQDPLPSESPLYTPPGDLDLSLHPLSIVEHATPQPLKVELTPPHAKTIPKVGRKLGGFFEMNRMLHGPLGLLQAKSESNTWKSFMWNLPRAVLKFALNASIDTLPTRKFPLSFRLIRLDTAEKIYLFFVTKTHTYTQDFFKAR